MHYTKTKNQLDEHSKGEDGRKTEEEGRKGKGKRRGCHLFLHGYSHEQTTNV